MNDTIQQQLIAARKNQILDAAASLFAEKGFHPTTTRDIAKRATISEGTIYNYFPTKTALLLAVFERMRVTALQGFPSEPQPVHMPLRDFIRTLIELPFKGLGQDGFALFRIVVSEMMVSEELRHLYNEQILAPTLALAETALYQHPELHGINPTVIQLAVRAISSMVMGLMMQYSLAEPVLSAQWETLPDTLTDLLIHGLLAQG